MRREGKVGGVAMVEWVDRQFEVTHNWWDKYLQEAEASQWRLEKCAAWIRGEGSE